jgi:hypothetical protein
MKPIFLSLLVIGLSSPAPSFAQWWNPFGPKNVEECIAEGGKTAQTETAMKFVIRDCRSKFTDNSQGAKSPRPKIRCFVSYDDKTRQFRRGTEALQKLPNVESAYLGFIDLDNRLYLEKLAKQLREADQAGNTELARAIAKEYGLNSITIVHASYLSEQFVKTVAMQQWQEVEGLCK